MDSLNTVAAGKPAAASSDILKRKALVSAVATKTGLPRDKALIAVEAVFDAISASLTQGHEVRVKGFGAFALGERKARTKRNPETGAETSIAAGKAVRFRAAKTLRGAVPQG